jgi:hypothetical protein
MGNSSAKSLAHCLQKDNSAKSLAQAILPNHWHAPPHSGYSAKSLAKPLMLAHCPSWRSLANTVILPNHWHRQFCQITGTGNSAKSLARSSTCRLFSQINGTLCPQTDNSAKSLAQAIMGNCAKSLAHCLQNDNSAKSLAQAILPNLWHAPPHSGYSAKSLAQPILPTHWHAPPHTGNSAKSLAHCPSWRSLANTVILPNHWHRQFCQITGTGNSAKSLARSSTCRLFCQIGTLCPQTDNSAKSLAQAIILTQANPGSQTRSPILQYKNVCTEYKFIRTEKPLIASKWFLNLI